MAAKRKVITITQDELMAANDEARMIAEARSALLLGPPIQARPPGAYSIKEWAKHLAMGESATKVRIRRAVAEGIFERLIVSGRDCTGRTYTLPVYRKVKGAPNAMDRI